MGGGPIGGEGEAVGGEAVGGATVNVTWTVEPASNLRPGAVTPLMGTIFTSARVRSTLNIEARTLVNTWVRSF
jgi:hypothetical protein